MAIDNLRVIREETSEIDGGKAYAFEWEMERNGRTQRFLGSQTRTDTEAAYTMHTRVEIATVGEPSSPEKINLQEITIDGIKGEISESGATRHDFMTITTVINGGFTTRDSREVDVRLDLAEAYAGMDMATMLRRQFMGEGPASHLPGAVE